MSVCVLSAIAIGLSPKSLIKPPRPEAYGPQTSNFVDSPVVRLPTEEQSTSEHSSITCLCLPSGNLGDFFSGRAIQGYVGLRRHEIRVLLKIRFVLDFLADYQVLHKPQTTSSKSV